MRDVVICEPVLTPSAAAAACSRTAPPSTWESPPLAYWTAPASTRTDRRRDLRVLQHQRQQRSTGDRPGDRPDAGLPVTVPGQHLDRRCGSGLQAVINAVMQVLTGAQNLVLAGGTESMSNAPFYSTDIRWGGAHRCSDARWSGPSALHSRRPFPGGARRNARDRRQLPPARGRRPGGRSSPKRLSRSPCPAATVTPSSTPTSIPARAPRSKHWRNSDRSCLLGRRGHRDRGQLKWPERRRGDVPVTTAELADELGRASAFRRGRRRYGGTVSM